MLQTLSEHWWVMLIRGILAIIFGIIAFAQTEVTALALVYVFGAYAIVEGALTIWGALRGEVDHRIWWFLWGIVSIVAGLIAFAQPLLTFLTLVFVVGVWAIVTGVVQIFAAIRLRREISGEFWLILLGLLSVIAGVILIARPVIGGLSLVWVIGAYAIVFGIGLIFLSFRLKGMGEAVTAGQA
jgi:uncharacterized membrane protein HdeD (DUF308 family)